ncbi:MAG TPA: hypothetical protein PKN95_10820 [Verrucomicrobiota bacterium]|nr:hypothetical protein [Verrucomicrobiota bacterium]HNT15662.1 hypothetical protein [Verrucomicrobiota bacterium]
MQFDLRFPIGLLFSVYGVLLLVYGLVGDQEQYARSLNLNINLVWGIVMLCFGLAMLFFARRGAKKS